MTVRAILDSKGHNIQSVEPAAEAFLLPSKCSENGRLAQVLQS